MCGIAGMVSVGRCANPDAVLAALAHRGPDGARAVTPPSAECTLFSARLAVVDPLARALQPMHTDDGRYWIAFNGEIYNHREIRRALSPRGGWRTDSDTETLLHAFHAWGAGCVPRLRGMFAFAVWDDRERSLLLVRDPLGIKPLLYGWTASGGFVFASELRALVSIGALPTSIDMVAVADVLRQGAIRQPRTLLDHAKMFPAGHTGYVVGGRMLLSKYWDPCTFCRHGEQAPAYEDAVQQIRDAVEDAARAHALADVPIGAFLSGGIDSRIVASSMQRLVPAPLPTFTVGFGTHDERLPARATARDLGTDHHDRLLTEADWPALLDQFLDAIDQPSVDGLNTLAACALARTRATVALSGLGADELFGGYPHFSILSVGSPMRQRAIALRRAMSQGLALQEEVASGTRRHRRLTLGWDRPEALLLMARSGAVDAGLRAQRTVPGDASAEAAEEALAAAASCIAATDDPVNQVSLHELQGYLRDTLLRDVDAISMRLGIEVRPVLLDTPLVELALSLPGSFKLRQGRHKAVLKDAFRDVLAPDVLNRPKAGFEVPAREWTPRACVDLWMAAFGSPTAVALLNEEFRLRAQSAGSERRKATHAEWAAFVLVEVLRRQGLSP